MLADLLSIMFSKDPETLPPKSRYQINQSFLILEVVFGTSQIIAILLHWLR